MDEKKLKQVVNKQMCDKSCKMTHITQVHTFNLIQALKVLLPTISILKKVYPQYIVNSIHVLMQ